MVSTMAFKQSGVKSVESTEHLQSVQGLAGGEPLLVVVESIVDDRTIKAKLMVDGLGTKEGTSVTVEQAVASPNFRSLSAAITGSERVAPLRAGDIVCFDKAYVNKGRAAVGIVTARTHDKMRGHVQAITCMAKVSRASVSERGATQFVSIINPAEAMVAEHMDHVKKAFEIVSSKPLPGGEPGFIIRQNGGGGITWTLKKGEKFQALLEDLEHNEVFADGAKIELIPAWSLPSGRDQVSLDVDPRKETGPVFGPVSTLFQTDARKGLTGYVACLAIIGEEEEFAFGGPTGKVIRAVSGLQPCFRRQPVDAMRVPSKVRAYGGAPNTIRAVWNEEQVAKMTAERIGRRGPDPEVRKPATNDYAKSAGSSNRAEIEQEERRPNKTFGMGRR
jgi:hypothetical protein